MEAVFNVANGEYFRHSAIMLFVVSVVTSLCLSTSCLADDIADIKVMLTALNAKVATMESMITLSVTNELESTVGGK